MTSKDGRYGIAVDLGKDENGKRIRPIKTGKTEQEVIDKMKRWLCDNGYMDPETVVINGQSTANELVKAFRLDDMIVNKKTGKPLSDVAFENYSYALKHFESYFSGQKLCMIDTVSINRFFQTMMNAKENGRYKYSQCTLDRVEYIVERMFNWAVKNEYISASPLKGPKYKKPVSRKETDEITALSSEESAELNRILKTNELVYPVFALMSVTGMRTQEALAIRWEDVDFQNGTLYIHQALTKEITWDEHRNKIAAHTVVGGTKTQKSRVIPVPQDAMNMLKEWREKAPKISKTKIGDGDFVFGNSKGSSWTYGGFRSSVNRVLMNAGVDRLRLHRLRHTVATMMSNQPDVTVFNIMDLLGHAKIQTSQGYIDRATPERLKKNREVLNRLSEEAKLLG